MDINKYLSQKTDFYNNKDDTADFYIVVKNGDNNKRIGCHRVVIEKVEYISECLKPREFFNNPTENELVINERHEDIWKIIIAYLYGCQINFTKLNLKQKYLLLEKAKLCSLDDLVSSLINSIEFIINYENILILLEIALIHELKSSEEICLKFIRTNIKELMSFDKFIAKLTREQLIYIFYDFGNGLYINELDVLYSVGRWMKFHLNLFEDVYKDIWEKCVRLELLTPEEFCENLLPFEIFTIEEYNQAVETNVPRRERNERQTGIDFSKSPNVNVIGGDNTDSLLDDNYQYERQSQFPHSKHLEENPIIIDLGEIRLINFIELHLFDGINSDSPNISFSYLIETSIEIDGHYSRVIDHYKYICRSKQKIYFYPREVRYVKIVGIASYVNLSFDENNDYLFLRSFSCQLTDEPFDITKGFWAPQQRVTDSEIGCLLAIGENNPGGNIPWMLKTDCPQTNYSYHKIGRKHKRKALMIHLTQPVYINHIALRLIGINYQFSIRSSDCDPNQFVSIMEDTNRDETNFEHKQVHFLQIRGSSENSDEFKCSDLSCS